MEFYNFYLFPYISIVAANMNVEEALAQWAKEVASIQQSEFSLSTWSSDEVRILSSGVARFSDDFHNICPFLPGKTQKSIANLYYTFWSMFDGKETESIIRLFQLSETHRPQLRHALLGNSSAISGTLLSGATQSSGSRKNGSTLSSSSRKRGRQETGGKSAVSGGNKKGGKSGGKQARGNAATAQGGKNGSSSSNIRGTAVGRGLGNDDIDAYNGMEEEEFRHSVENDLDEGDDEGRVLASQRFLSSAKEMMPGGDYASLVDLLVEFDSEHITMTRLISEIMGLLQPYPKLEAGFHPFLPPTWEVNGPTNV